MVAAARRHSAFSARSTSSEYKLNSLRASRFKILTPPLAPARQSGSDRVLLRCRLLADSCAKRMERDVRSWRKRTTGGGRGMPVMTQTA